MCTLGNFPDSVLVLSAPRPPFSNPLPGLELKFSPTVSMPPAGPRQPPAAAQVCGCRLGCSLCVAAEHSTPGRNSLGQTSVLFEGGAGVGHRELGLCFLLPPLLLIFIWSLANHLPSVFPSCRNTWVPSAPSCFLVWFWFSFSFHGGMLFFDLGYFGNNFQITR